MADKKGLTVADMAAVVVASDPALQKRLKRLVNQAIDQASYIMVHGTDYAKLQIIRQMTPHMLSAMQEAESGARTAEQEATYNRIMAELRGEA